jgi:hypothetical protein
MVIIHTIESGSQVEARLAELGLDYTLLIEALRQANLYRARLTAHHPRLYRYQVMSAETVAALRDLLIPRGWDKLDEGNYELTVNEDHSLAVAVASGDEGTGNSKRTPSNKSPKGRHTVEAVAANRQADLFAELLPPTTPKIEKADTWVLLHNVKSDRIEAELSRPNEIDEDGKIVSWSERILLGAIPLDGETVTINPPQLPDVDISISRKVA